MKRIGNAQNDLVSRRPNRFGYFFGFKQIFIYSVLNCSVALLSSFDTRGGGGPIFLTQILNNFVYSEYT